MSNLHSADASFLGYYYQGMYALVKLLDAEDCDKISIETEDDVFLEGKIKTLFQLKHSLDSKGSLTEKNDGFWKTIRIWAQKIKESEVDESTYFIFVTPLSINQKSLLRNFTIEGSDRTNLIDLLLQEAKRVKKAREDAEIKSEKPLPYNTRAVGCQVFLELSDQQRKELVDKITVHPNNFNLTGIKSEIEKRIKNTVPVNIRELLIDRLIEWWDRRIVLGLLNEADREVQKLELTQQIHTISISLLEDNLPDDYSYRDDEVNVDEEIGVGMETQIDLVNGGPSRKERAVIARWQAINQRAKWISEDIIHSFELNKLDKQLVKVWKETFGPMKDDLEGELEETLCKEGCKLLDWSHKKAHLEVIPVRSRWNQPFLVQGTYQHLANELKVGWHPDYENRLAEKKEEDKK